MELPERGELARVLGRVRVAEHDLVEAVDHALVRGHRQHALDDGRRVLEVLAGLEERGDAHRLRHAALDLKQPHREHVGGGARHRDAVRAQALGREGGERSERVEHLAHLVVARERLARGDERALGDQLGFEPREARALVPLEVGAEAEEARDRVEGLRVTIALLPKVDLGHVDPKRAYAADEVEEGAVGEHGVARRDEGAVHELKWREELGGRHVHVRVRGEPRRALRVGLDHVLLLHTHAGLVQPATDRHQQHAVRLVARAARLERLVDAVLGLRGEDLALRGARLLGPGDLLHLHSHLVGDRARVRELEQELLDLAVVELGGARAHQGDHV